jgi:hypothetical protein
MYWSVGYRLDFELDLRWHAAYFMRTRRIKRRDLDGEGENLRLFLDDSLLVWRFGAKASSHTSPHSMPSVLDPLGGRTTQ